MIVKAGRKLFELMQWGVSGALLAIVMMTFQNCGSDFVMKDSLDLASGVTESKIACELQAFQSSYMPFLAKCKNCHIPGGSGAGAFSSTNVEVAHNAFLLATTAKIDERAVNVNHAPGTTGPANQAAIDTARPQYENALAACNGGGGDDEPVGTGLDTNPAVTIAKNLPATGTQTLTFNLASEVTSGQSVPGATFSITITASATAGGGVLYQFSQPRVTTTTSGLRVANVMFDFNGNDLPLVTTYSRVDRTLGTNQTNVSLSGASTAYEAPAPGGTPHRLGISFGILVPQ